jgi:RNA polymerase sigma-70 factor (ECF subfamily)
MESMANEASVVEARVEDFADFFRSEYETLLRAMYLLSGDRFEAEELAQAAFVKAWERWDRISEMDNPSGYLYRTAVNIRRSALRKLSTAARRALLLHESDPVSESDDRDQIRRMLATLPANQREAVVLVDWLGFSDVDAAKVLGISAGAVRVRISRARASLRPLIEEASI